MSYTERMGEILTLVAFSPGIFLCAVGLYNGGKPGPDWPPFTAGVIYLLVLYYLLFGRDR